MWSRTLQSRLSFSNRLGFAIWVRSTPFSDFSKAPVPWKRISGTSLRRRSFDCRRFSWSEKQANQGCVASKVLYDKDNEAEYSLDIIPLSDPHSETRKWCRQALLQTHIIGSPSTATTLRRRNFCSSEKGPERSSLSPLLASNNHEEKVDPSLRAEFTTESSSVPSKRQRRKPRVLRDPDQELYEQIRTTQDRRKEEADVQTAKNVYRSLLGNVVVAVAKLGAWVSSGSSGMLAEFVHSLVDCGNQALLLVGLRDSRLKADRKHPYGYGKSVYFWALVSALGTFFLGAGVSMTHALANLANPTLQEITPEVWGVLIIAFSMDGYIFQQTIRECLVDKPVDVSWWKHVSNIRDPATLAILLEDGASCLGIVMALSGIMASHMTGSPMYDAVAGVGIATLLGAMGVTLVKVNHRFLLGRAVDKQITDDIERILLSQRSIEGIGSVQSQWTGPETFSFKAEVDFDGTYFAAKLMPIYQQEFPQFRESSDEELQVLLSLYAEDIIRTIEREVRRVEAQIRIVHPGAEYIELEPMSIDADRLAIDNNLEEELRRNEIDTLVHHLKTLNKEEATGAQQAQQSTTTAVPPKNN